MKRYLLLFLPIFLSVACAEAQQRPDTWAKETVLRGKNLAGYSQENGQTRGYKVDSLLAQGFGIYQPILVSVPATGNPTAVCNKIVTDYKGITYAIDFYGNAKILVDTTVFATKADVMASSAKAKAVKAGDGVAVDSSNGAYSVSVPTLNSLTVSVFSKASNAALSTLSSNVDTAKTNIRNEMSNNINYVQQKLADSTSKLRIDFAAAADWSKNGNTNVTASQFIGTIDSTDLVFKSKNIEILRLDSKVGAFWSKGTSITPATTGVTPVTGAGIRMMWLPNKAAFRAGRVTGTEWDTIGTNSIGLGINAKATGNSSVSISGTATYSNSIAIRGTASSSGAVAISGTASGFGAVAIGNGDKAASGESSVVIGGSSLVRGGASGRYAISIGGGTSSGHLSFSQGLDSKAKAINGVTFGQYNDTTDIIIDPEIPTDLDRIFQIGNGYFDNVIHYSNAVTMLRNGNFSIGSNYAPTEKLEVSGRVKMEKLQLTQDVTPSSSSDTQGNTGDICKDNNYMYVKTSSGWKRAALSTF